MESGEDSVGMDERVEKINSHSGEDGFEKPGWWDINRQYPRDYDRYIKTTHFEESLVHRDIEEENIERTLWEGEFFEGRRDTLGFELEIDGITFAVIAGPHTVRKAAKLITAWSFVSDEDEALDEESQWSENYVEKVRIATKRHVKERDRREELEEQING